MPKICEMLLSLECFQCAMSLDLNIVYYCMRLINQAINLYTIILPWVKYQLKSLPMGICNSPEIFQEKMNEIFRGFEFIRTYINDLLIITKDDWSNHLNKLERDLQNHKYNDIKYNIKNSFFGQTQMEYLGFWVTPNGIRPVNNKSRIHSKYDATK